MVRVWPAARQRRTAEANGPDESTLVRRARHGDTDAFGSLVRLYQDAIYRLALRMVGPDAAEDIAQQAFFKAWEGLDRFAGGSTFGTWLYRIAVNTCLDHLRCAGRFRSLPLDSATATLVAAAGAGRRR